MISGTADNADFGEQCEPTLGGVSARAAASALGINERTIRRAIARGALPAIKFAGTFHIAPADLECYRRQLSSEPSAPSALIVSLQEARRAHLGSVVPRRLIPHPILTLPPLPVTLTSFVGREELSALVMDRLCRRDTRLVTLTGPGGVGKTRLAVNVADALRAAFADGIGYVHLADVRDSRRVLPTLAHALGVQERDHSSLARRVQAHLGDHECLIVLDNFEQVTSAAPMLVELLTRCPHLTLLVTSRTPVRVSGEQVVVVPPLTLASPEADANIMDSEAVRLFMARADAVVPGKGSIKAAKPVVAKVCARLDGLPLAIELAAARMNILSPRALLAGLDERLPLLTGGGRDQPPRLQTMKDSIAWSYDLLTPNEQELFRRLAVCIGAFSLQTASVVAAANEHDVLGGLTALIEHSLVQPVDTADGVPRFTMLKTIREFGLDQLASAGQPEDVHTLHARHFLALAVRAEREADGPEAAIWLARLDLDLANVQAALNWYVEYRHPADALRMAAALWHYWCLRGHLTEGRDSLRSALAVHGQVEPGARADALWKLGYLLYSLGEYELAHEHIERSVSLFHDAGDRSGEATALDALGTVWQLQQNLQQAHACFEEALAMRLELGERIGTGVTLANLGMLIALHHDDVLEGRAMLEEALAITRDSGSRRHIANRCINLGRVEFADGNLAVARGLIEYAMTVFEDVSDQVAIASALEVLGQIACEVGERSRGLALLVASLRMRLKLGLYRKLGDFVERLASAVVPLDPALAARLMAAADADRDATGVARLAWDAAAWDRAAEAARSGLGPSRFDVLWRSGRCVQLLDLLHDVKNVLVTLVDTVASTDAEGHPPDLCEPDSHGLTPRELDVLRLVATGRSNKAIADALFISPRTVKGHMMNIFGKLGVDSRSSAAIYAHEHSSLLNPPARDSLR